MSRLDFAVCAIMTVLQAPSSGLPDTFNSDIRSGPDVSYFIAMLALVINLNDSVDVCPIVDGSIYDMATSVMTWEVIKCVHWPVVYALSFFQLLSYAVNTGKVSVFNLEGAVRIVHDDRTCWYPNLCYLRYCFCSPYLNELLCIGHPLSICSIVIRVPSRKQFYTCRLLWIPNLHYGLLLLIVQVVVHHSPSPSNESILL